MLLLVQGDSEYTLIRRRGRFSMERSCAANPAYRSAATKAAMAKFLRTMNSMGYEYYNDGNVEVRSDLPHLEFSDSSTLDLGPVAMPDPRDVVACERFEREEKSKQAADVPDYQDIMDVHIVCTFKKKLRKSLVPKLKLAHR